MKNLFGIWNRKITRLTVLVALTGGVLVTPVAMAANPALFYAAPRCGYPNQVVVAFKSGAGYTALNTATVNVKTNYTVSGRTVTSALFDTAANSAILTLNSNMANLGQYTLNIANIKDTNGATIAASSDTFYYSSSESGLVGEYYAGKTLSGTPTVQFDSTLDADFAGGFLCGLLPFLCGTDTSARWKGFVRPSESGNFKFETISNDGSRVWVNSFTTPIIDYWGTDSSSNVTKTSANQALVANTYYPVKQEFYYDRQGFIFYDSGHIELRWTPPSSSTAIIPSNRLSTCVAVTGAPTLDHFNFTTPATSNACGGNAAVTITAIGSDGNTLTGYSGTINLTTTSNYGDWTKTTANGVLNNGTSDDGAATYAFTSADNGVIALSLGHAHAGTAKITANAAAEGKSSTSSSIQFLSSGLTIKEVTSTGWDVVAGRSHAIKVEYGLLDEASNTCTTANFNGPALLKFWMEPTASNPVGAIVPSLLTTPLKTTQAQAISLLVTIVSGIGTSSLALNTTDVGQFNLKVIDDLSGFVTTALGLPVAISGTQSGGLPITVRPFGLLLDATGNTKAANAQGLMFKKAGEDFTVTLQGLLYNAAEDVNGDGVPDAFADSDPSTSLNPSNISVTPHLGLTSMPVLSSALAAPAGGNPGILSAGLATIGSASVSGLFNYSEVGIIELATSVTSYLGKTVNLVGKSGYVGRFVPHHFDVVANAVKLDQAWLDGDGDGINDWDCNFAYFGQGLGLDSAPELTFTAKNKGNIVTQNYAGAFNKFSGSTGTLVDTGLPAGSTSSLTLPVSLAATVVDDSTPGLFRQTITGFDTEPYTLAYSKPLKPGAAEVPFTTALELVFPNNSGANLVDSDAVCYQTDSDGDSVTDTCQPFRISDMGGMNIVYGRLNIDNNFGPEINELILPVRSEYWKLDGGMYGFYVNSADNKAAPDPTACTGTTGINASLSFDSSTKGNVEGHTVATLIPLVNGLGQIVMSAPGAGHDGQVGISLLGPDFLKYDFDGNGVLEAANARATFGIYGGKGSPVIFQRESHR